MSFDISNIRNDFPILEQKINGKPLVYFDNAATTQKPVQVLNRILNYYKTENSNVHRGVHKLSQIATEEFENARKYIARFINAESTNEIIFTRGTTESVNLLASIFQGMVSEGDQIVVTGMEHHSNLVPWQQLCKQKKADLKIIPVKENGELDLHGITERITVRTKMVALAHISNVLGTINPVKEIADVARKNGALVFVDGAQATAHIPINVQALDCDFYALSAHKAYGPMGVGILYGKKRWLEKLPPYQFGGEMVDQVSFSETTYNSLPFKFEAGTPNVAGVLGMAEALKYIKTIGIARIREYEDDLLDYASKKILEIDGIRIVGSAKHKTAVLSFVVEGVHPYDLGTLLDQMGIAIRTGYHCAQPLVESMGLTGTLRASFALYNTVEEVDVFVESLKKSINMLG